MKKLIFFLFLFGAFQAVKAQSVVDTVVSVSQGDSIVIQKGGIEIQPVVANSNGDSARSMNFYAFDVKSDSTQGCQTYVQLFDKTGKVLDVFNQPIPASVVNQWKIDPTVMFDYIISKRPRLKRP